MDTRRSTVIKGVAIQFMLVLHLFATKDYFLLYDPVLLIGDIPLEYYIALFGDCCVAMFCFVSGYGIYASYKGDHKSFQRKNIRRVWELLKTYWIVLIIFVLVCGPLLGKAEELPGSFLKIVSNIFLLSSTYNGAWWFVLTYILLVACSQPLIGLLNKYNPISIVTMLIVIYLIGFLVRFKSLFHSDIVILQWFVDEFGLFSMSLFPFAFGGIVARYKSIFLVSQKMGKLNTSLVSIIGIGLMGLLHAYVETIFLSAFIGITVCIILMNAYLINSGEKTLFFIGKHSTIIWLVHMFIYVTYFRSFIYASRNPVIIYFLLLSISLGISIVITYLRKYIVYIKLDRFHKVI